MANVLIVGPHPDDQELGMGGTANGLRLNLGVLALRSGALRWAVRNLARAAAGLEHLLARARPDMRRYRTETLVHALRLESTAREQVGDYAAALRAAERAHTLADGLLGSGKPAAADLARRYAAGGSPEEAERALTNLVEPLPHEAEGHRRLAALRSRAGDHEAAHEPGPGQRSSASKYWDTARLPSSGRDSRH